MSERQWQRDDIAFGFGELDLCKAVDQIPPTHFARMKNVMRTMMGALTARPGLTTLCSTTLGQTVHSVARLEDPANNNFTRIVGVDSGVYFTRTSTLQQAETGFSGRPLSLVPFRPNLSAESWMLIGDGNKMRKIRRDGLILPMGLSTPQTGAVAVAAAKNITYIDVGMPGGWTARNNGTTTGTINGSTFIATPSNDTIGSAFMDKAVNLDLSKVGSVDAAGEDHIHVRINFTNPYTDYLRISFICAATFTPNVLPGANGFNPDFYSRTFRPGDYGTSYIELGTIGYPLRREEFNRVGDTAGRDWSTITGICIELATSSETHPAVVEVDDLWLEGGGGLDSSDLEALPYTYVFTHYDPRTDTESNPSAESMPEIHAIRGSASVWNPSPYGDVNIRQRFYRKGGTNTDTFYYIGTTDSDGGTLVDSYTDTEIYLAGTVAYDHDVPVTTELSSGGAKYEQPLPYIAGPLGGAYIFGCGDPNRRGHLYWSRPYEPDHWPATNNREVCSPSEQLLAPLMYNGQGFIFSRERLFQAILNLNASGTEGIDVLPTPCGHGIAGPYAWAVGPEIYFVSRDGIYATTGGVERNLTEERLAPLFHREWEQREDPTESSGGYGEGGYGEGGYGQGAASNTFPGPINWTAEDSLRLTVHENELRFLYLDTAGMFQELVYHLLTHEWRWNAYSKVVHTVVSERDGQDSILLYGSGEGKVYENTGFSDDGFAISCLIRTGARNQGIVRAEKLYGDITVDAELKEVSLSVRSYLNPAENFNNTTSCTGDARALYRHDHFPGGTLGRTASLELAWSSAEVRPIIYNAEISFLPEPERIGTRVTDWDDHNFQGYKLVKGVILECNTFGAAKNIAIEADGVEQTIITVTANGRRQIEVAFPAFQGKLIRLRPVDTTDLALYSVNWIADDLPLSLSRWETRPLDNGLFGYHMHYDSYVTLNSTTPVTFSLTFDGVVKQSYTIPSTAGRTIKCYVPFYTNKALLVEYLLTSTDPFMVFRDETYVRIFPWDQPDSILFKPFGGANQDPSPRAV